MTRETTPDTTPTPTITLTPVQQQMYHSFGFLLIRDFLAKPEVQTLRDAVTRLKVEESGESDPLKHRGRVVGMFHQDHALRDLFDDPRLDAIARQLLPSDRGLRFLGDEYVSFSSPADWHPDMPTDAGFESLKFGFYLDDVSQGGFLRVVPGSHHAELFQAVEAFRKSTTPLPEMDAAHTCMTRPGDLLIFNLKLWHQGTANPEGTHRRVIFWSVGEPHERFDEYARNFHERNHRGGVDTPWPAGMLDGAPAYRLEMLDVYPAESGKQQSLANI